MMLSWHHPWFDFTIWHNQQGDWCYLHYDGKSFRTFNVRMKKFITMCFSILILCGSVTAAKSHKKTIEITNAQVILRVPAWSEVLAKGRVVVLEKDFLHLAAYDASTGKLQWRRKFQDEANGIHDLHGVGGDVFVWAGNRIHVVSALTGKTAATYSAPWNGSKPPCSLAYWNGVCSFRCQCQVYLFHCSTGKQLGIRYNKTYVEFFDFSTDGAPSGGCYGPGGAVMGRARNTIILMVEDEKARPYPPRFRRTLAIISLDTRTGKERWRLAGLEADYFLSSKISKDRASFFLADDNGHVQVFDSQSGKKLFERKMDKSQSKSAWDDPADDDEEAEDDLEFTAWLDHPKALFMFTRGTAELLDGKTFKTRWKKNGFKKGELAIPTGVALGNYELFMLGKPHVIKLLDSTKGKVLTKVRLCKYGRLVSDGHGGFFAFGTPLRKYDSKGRVTKAKVSIQGMAAEIRGGFVVLRGRNAGIILDDKSLEAVTDIEGRFTVSDMDSSSPSGSLLLHGFSPANPPSRSAIDNTIGEAVLVRIKDQATP